MSSIIEITPNWGKFIDSLRHVGYDNYDAIKDLIDNSIDADADQVKVSIKQQPAQGQKAPRLSSKKNKKIGSVTIVDNGRGMTKPQLIEAMKLGSKTEYNSEALGKFGMGLITASISMGRCLTVVTRRQGSDKINIAKLDLDEVKKTGTMACTHKEVSFSNDILGTERVKDFGPFSEDGFGTIVEISKLDQMTNSDATQMANHLRGLNHLARTFRFLMGDEGINIFVNGKEVVPCDVLDWNNSLGSTIAMTSGWEKAVFNGHEFKYRSTFQYPRTTGQGGGRKRVRKGSSGISLMRNRREIEFGKTYGFYSNTTNFAGFQMELMLPDVLVDKYVGVTFSKNGASKKDEFVHQGFKDFLAEEVINPLRRAAGKIFQKELTSDSFDSLSKEQQTFSERLQKIGDILDGLPDRIKKKHTRKPDSQQPKASEKKKPSNVTGKSYGRKDIIWDFVTKTDWPSDEVMLDIREYLLDDGKTKIDILLNGSHKHVVNNYIQSESEDLRNLQLKWFTALALMLRGMSDENEAAYSKFFNQMSRNLTTLESTR